MKNIKKIFQKIIDSTNVKTIIHLSHNDLDGYGCQYITYKLLNEKVIYSNCNYDTIESKLNELFKQLTINNKNEKYLILTDLGVTTEVSTKVFNFCKSNKVNFVIIDHHKTTESSKLVIPNNLYLNIDFCATKLIFQCLKSFNIEKSNDLNEFVEIVNNYDLWCEQESNFNLGKIISDLMFNENIFKDTSLDNKYKFYLLEQFINEIKTTHECYFIEKQIFDWKENFLNIVDSSEFIKNKNIFQKEKFIRILYEISYKNSKMNFIYIGKQKGIYLHNVDSTNFQFISKWILEDNKNIKFVINIKNSGRLAIRSQNDCDCSLICEKYFNGGGHKYAAGGEMDKKMIFKLQEYITNFNYP